MDSAGHYYVTTLSGGVIMKLDAGGEATFWVSTVCPNGQIIMPTGDHLVCDSQLRTISRFSPEGALVGHEVTEWCSGREVHTPNDLVVDTSGGIYFTDSIRHTGSVFYVGSNSEQSVVATNLDYPNGLVLSPDESRLFVAESYQNRVLVIDLMAPGRARGAAELFAQLPVHTSGRSIDNLPDGMALDRKGRLWVAHYGMQAIQVLSPQGNWLFSLDTGLPLTSNVLITAETNEYVDLLITGGFGEPGPGAVLKLMVNDRLEPI